VRRTAEALYHRAQLDVEVLTTCSAEFNSDWSRVFIRETINSDAL